MFYFLTLTPSDPQMSINFHLRNKHIFLCSLWRNIITAHWWTDGTKKMKQQSYLFSSWFVFPYRKCDDTEVPLWCLSDSRGLPVTIHDLQLIAFLTEWLQLLPLTHCYLIPCCIPVTIFMLLITSAVIAIINESTYMIKETIVLNKQVQLSCVVVSFYFLVLLGINGN